jgi:hypothetical protein
VPETAQIQSRPREAKRADRDASAERAAGCVRPSYLRCSEREIDAEMVFGARKGIFLIVVDGIESRLVVAMADPPRRSRGPEVAFGLQSLRDATALKRFLGAVWDAAMGRNT